VRRAAELLDALPDDDLDTELTSCTENFSPQTDPVELRLEQNELPEYLMAKAFFDCHEPQRCTAVFLPRTSSENRFPMRKNPNNATHGKVPTSKCKAISQRALFLAWYALLMAGEKEKVEELNQILGPADTGAIVNKQLALLRHMLDTWFNEAQQNPPKHGPSQGWLEYLYCIPHSELVDSQANHYFEGRD
jgi:anaphase-promoting complex subunit 8